MGLVDLVSGKFDSKMIDTKNWVEYQIDSLFSVTRPDARVATQYDDGKVPFIASGNYNNGVEKYVKPRSDSESKDKGNCITVSPVDGSTFYQEFDFLGRGGAGSSIIILRNENLNKFNALFLCAVIRKIATKYNYSNMCSAEKLKKEIINIPSINQTSPDWKFMEKFMKDRYNLYTKLLLK